LKIFESKKKLYGHYDEKVKKLEEKHFLEKQSKKESERMKRVVIIKMINFWFIFKNHEKFNVSLNNYIDAKESVTSVLEKRYSILNKFFENVKKI